MRKLRASPQQRQRRGSTQNACARSAPDRAISTLGSLAMVRLASGTLAAAPASAARPHLARYGAAAPLRAPVMHPRLQRGCLTQRPDLRQAVVTAAAPAGAAAVAAVLTPAVVFDAATLFVLPFYTLMVAAPKSRITQRLLSGTALLLAAAALYGLLLLLWAPLPQLAGVASDAAAAVAAAARAGAPAAAWRAAQPSMPAFAALFGRPDVTALAWVHLVLLDLWQARWVPHSPTAGSFSCAPMPTCTLFRCSCAARGRGVGCSPSGVPTARQHPTALEGPHTQPCLPPPVSIASLACPHPPPLLRCRWVYQDGHRYNIPTRISGGCWPAMQPPAANEWPDVRLPAWVAHALAVHWLGIPFGSPAARCLPTPVPSSAPGPQTTPARCPPCSRAVFHGGPAGPAVPPGHQGGAALVARPRPQGRRLRRLPLLSWGLLPASLRAGPAQPLTGHQP